MLGKGSVAALRALGAARAMLLISPSLSANTQMMERLRRCVGALETRVVTLPSGEPTMAGLRPALAEVTEFRPDWLVAVGGGSVLDAAKLIWVFYEHPDSDLDRLFRPFAVPDLRGKARLAALPTTAGTGSEVSSATVLSDPGTGRKQAIVSHQLLPDLVILDPELATGVPSRVMASAGMDALAHAVESYVSRFANPLADHFAETAAATLVEYLPRLVLDKGDLDILLEVQMAALMAGWVQNLKVPGVGHAIAHQLGRFGLAHGTACGTLLSSSIKANCANEVARLKYRRLAGRIGLGNEEDLAVVVRNLARSIGLGSLDAEATGGIQALRCDLEKIVEGAMADICAAANPVLVDRNLIEIVLNDAG